MLTSLRPLNMADSMKKHLTNLLPTPMYLQMVTTPLTVVNSIFFCIDKFICAMANLTGVISKFQS